MATELDMTRHDGITPMAVERALAARDRALRPPSAALVVGHVDWDRFAAAHTATRPSALFARLVSEPPDAAEPSLVTDLNGLPAAKRTELLLTRVISHVAAVSGYRADAVPPHQPFRELGMDSLAAIQLRNRINADTGLRLAATVVYEHPTPAALAQHLDSSLVEPSRETRLLAQLRRLAAELADLAPDALRDRDEVDAAVDALTRAWRHPGAPAAIDLDAASDEEMFDLIDSVIGQGED